MSMSLRGGVAWRVIAAGLAILVLVAVVLLTDTSTGDASAEQPMICEDDATARLSPLFDAPLGDVALITMDRRPVMLHDLAGERLTALVFCSYRCPCSDGYIDRLRVLRDRYAARGVAFFAIHANFDEGIDGMQDYIERKDYPLPVYHDEMTAAADMMHATVTPEVFVFDPSWELRYHGRIDDDKSGFFIEEESLQLALDTLLSGRPLQHKEKLSLGCAIVREHPLEEALPPGSPARTR
jgi:hypothetical protein